VCHKNGICGGDRGPFCELILEKPEGRGVIGKIPSLGWYGYFLELHIMSHVINGVL